MLDSYIYIYSFSVEKYRQNVSISLIVWAFPREWPICAAMSVDHKLALVLSMEDMGSSCLECRCYMAK